MIRFAKPQDYPQLKALWAEVFGDSCEAVDAYFAQRHADENMLVDEREKTIAGMLSMLPFTLSANHNQRYQARYIYAVATRPEYRRQGIATALLHAAHLHIHKLGEAAAVLVPATSDLSAYYAKRGYHSAFSLDILTVKASTLSPAPPQGTFRTCSAEEYTHLRNLAFDGSGLYACWEETAVAYAIKTFAQPGGVTALAWKDGYGCAAWEQTDNGILVRELALPEGGWREALAVLHIALNAKQYTLRLRPGTIPGIAPTPFGMIRWLIPEPKLSGDPPYLSLAMD